MHGNTWKALERRMAKLFGAERNRLSGSSGRKDISRSDTTHPRLYIECKVSGAENAAINQWLKSAPWAREEGKIPLIVYHSTKHKTGDFVFLRVKDLRAVAKEIVTDE